MVMFDDIRDPARLERSCEFQAQQCIDTEATSWAINSVCRTSQIRAPNVTSIWIADRNDGHEESLDIIRHIPIIIASETSHDYVIRA